MSALHVISRLDAHHRLAVALGVACCAFIFPGSQIPISTRLVAVWDAFAVADLALAWVVLCIADPLHARKAVRLQDTGQTLIFVVVIIAALAAFVSIAFVLGPAKQLSPADRGLHLFLSIVAVVASWVLTHTVFAMRYAHLYYSGEAPEDVSRRHGGLDYPGGHAPDYLDFAYFSFVIGMTFQVSDVQITSRRIRRVALVHGVLSFAFNTIVLALAVSLISSFL